MLYEVITIHAPPPEDQTPGVMRADATSTTSNVVITSYSIHYTKLYDGATEWFNDDPNVNGPDNPNVLGDEDPTQILITSAPVFQVQKTSQDLTGDPAVLFAGDTLRYTITVKNIGTEDAVNVVLRDQIPANTRITSYNVCYTKLLRSSPRPSS